MMKKLLLLALIFIFSFNTRAQMSGSITNITCYPANPTTNDTIYLYVDCSFGSSSCDMFTSSHSVTGNTIFASSLHCLGMSTAMCNTTDTFMILPLSAGTYIFNMTLSSGSGGPPCTPGIVADDNQLFTFIVNCSLTGGSVYIDHTSWMMNATVNGMSQYSYAWTSGAAANQTPFYSSWSVTITDLISGCDTTISQTCIPDLNAVCMCTMIYAPVCGCDGNLYSNSCLADCADVAWTPAIPNGTLGGFLPCTQPSTCEVEIDGDSIICHWGDSILLEASPTSSSTPFVSYVWSTGATGHILSTTANFPGIYSVVATDSAGCVSTASFTVAVEEIVIYSIPSPSNICLGDSIILSINPVNPVNNIIWVPTGNTTPTIVDFPTASTTYIVEALDLITGCDRRGEILVTVDSCTVCIDSSLINPNIMCPMIWDPVCGCDSITYSNDCVAQYYNGVTSWTQGPCNVMPNFACMGGVAPGVTTCVGPGNYAMGQANVMAVYPTMAACLADSCNVIPLPPCSVEINNGAVNIEMCDGDTVTLEATTGFDIYLWTTSGPTIGTTRIITTTIPGIYTVVATDSLCADIDSIEVILYQSPPLSIGSVPNPPMICLGDTVFLSASPGFFSYFWNIWHPVFGWNLFAMDTLTVFDIPTIDTWYRLDAVDSNGCVVSEDITVYVDTCVSSVNNFSETQISIYPNPTSGKVNIDLPKGEDFHFTLSDLQGRLVLQKENIAENFVFDTKEISKGTYLIKLESVKGKYSRKLLIK